MRIFITGVTGFLGSHFAEYAAARHEVAGLCHSDPRIKRKLRAHLERRGVKLHQGSILNGTSLTAAMEGADCVCHFAAAFKESNVDDEYFRRLNVDGTVNVVEAAARAGVRRFVHCGTAGIYGQRIEGTIDESFEARPWNIYERTKLEAERHLRAKARELGIEYVILRPTAVYGPRDDRLLKLFKSAAKGRFPLFGEGEGRRHMVYVTDLADAFLRACEIPGAASKEMIVGGPCAVPLREMLHLLAEAIHRPACGPHLPLKPMLLLAAVTEDTCKVIKVRPPIYRRRMDFYLNDAEFSSKLANDVLGWRPQVDLPEGFQKTFMAYCQDGLIPAEAASARTAVTRSSVLWLAQAALSAYCSGGFLLA